MTSEAVIAVPTVFADHARPVACFAGREARAGAVAAHAGIAVAVGAANLAVGSVEARRETPRPPEAHSAVGACRTAPHAKLTSLVALASPHASHSHVANAVGEAGLTTATGARRHAERTKIARFAFGAVFPRPVPASGVRETFANNFLHVAGSLAVALLSRTRWDRTRLIAVPSVPIGGALAAVETIPVPDGGVGITFALCVEWVAES